MIQQIQRFKYVAIGMALVAILVLTACGGDATATPAPTEAPTATQGPTPTQVQTPTQEPAATSVPDPTATSTPVPAGTPEPTSMPTIFTDYSSVIAELSQQIQSIVDETGITGLSVALVDDQEMVWSEGFGYADKENGVKATPQTVYGVASVSKLFTAAAIMQLAERGEIDIDQPLRTYLPDFSINNRFPDAGPITPRNVMTHHSGLPSNWLNGMVAFGDDKDALRRTEFGNLVQEINAAHVANPPNTTFSYSNLGYELLGHTVEQATGQGFSDYVDDEILQPMGMESSSFRPTSDMKLLRSKEYLNGEQQEYFWGRDIPAGALNTTVEDLSRFMMMVFGDGEVDGQRILKTETLAEMLNSQNSDVPLDLNVRWGLGWWLLPLPGFDYAKTAWHSGGDGMWNSLLVTLPEHKVGVVVLSNSGEAALVNYQIATTILERALEVKAGIERPLADPLDIVSLSTDELLSYAGLYTTDLGWMNVRVDGANLYADLFGQSFKLLAHSEGRFAIEGLDWSEAQLTIRTVDGRTALQLYGFAVGGLGFGERIESTTVPEAWMDRVGAYEITNGKPGFSTSLTNVQLRYDNDFLVLDVTLSETGDRLAFPIGPLSEDEAVILGLGERLRGETISVVDVDGKEHLSYSGYLMRRLEAASIPDSQPLTDDVLAHFTSYVEGAMDRFHIPGAAVAVVADGEIVYAEGFGVGELGKDDPVTPNTLFGIGSMTKSINAMMVASLVDEGFLEWDTPAVEIWSDFQLADPEATSTVTVRDLLSMRTGMIRDDDLWAGKSLSAEELMVALAQVPVSGQPGERHSYDNQGVVTAAYLGTLAAGGEFGGLFDAYAELIQERVFDPIGMANSTLDFESMDAHPEGARPHNWNDTGQPVPSGGFFEDFVPGEGITAAGGVASTANDLARYLITQLNRGVSPEGEQVVSAETLTETWVPQISISSGPDAFLDRVWLPSSLYNPVDSQYDYGMGWFVGTYNGVPVVHNPGDQAGWSAYIALLPESNTGIVVLTNANLLPCGAYMKIAVQHRLIELRYGMDNQIDGYIDQISDTVREAFGIEC